MKIEDKVIDDDDRDYRDLEITWDDGTFESHTVDIRQRWVAAAIDRAYRDGFRAGKRVPWPKRSED